MFYMHFIAFIYVFLDKPINKMPSASFLFSTFFVSEILHRKYSRNCTGRKPPTLHCRHIHGHRRRDRGEPRGPHTTSRHGPTFRRASRLCGAAPGARSSPIYTPSPENPKYLIIIPRKVPSLPSPPSSSTLDWKGSGALPSTLSERRSSPEGSTSPCMPPV